MDGRAFKFAHELAAERDAARAFGHVFPNAPMEEVAASAAILMADPEVVAAKKAARR